LFIAGTGVYFGFTYQNWPMKEIFFVAREIVSALLYPYKSNKTNDQKSEIFTKIMDVYSYRRTHKPALCGAGVLW
jgi:hypothetical protein